MTWQRDLKSAYGLDDRQIQAFERLLDILVASADRNLTAVTGRKRIVDVHFRDSLCLLAFEELGTAADICDIGSGAGFPGIPLAIALPGKKFTLIESNGKKCAFLDSTASRLVLKNASVLHARAEEAARTSLRDSFDLALARAVGPLPVVIEYALPLLRPGGKALLQRGARETGDENLADSVAHRLRGSLDSISAVEPYPGSKNLNVWIFSKTGPTPGRFPRRPGMARKRPLKA